MTELPPNTEEDLPLPFPLQKAIESVRKKENCLILEFEYQGNLYQVVVNDIAVVIEDEQTNSPDAPREYRTELLIKNKIGERLGKLKGKVLFEGQQFVSFQAINFGFEKYDGKPDVVPHISGLVGETICQLVLKGVFAVWFSSKGHSTGGKDMYQKISGREGIAAEWGSFYDNQMRWKLTKAQKE